jgi:hypothetical protein
MPHFYITNRFTDLLHEARSDFLSEPRCPRLPDGYKRPYIKSLPNVCYTYLTDFPDYKQQYANVGVALRGYPADMFATTGTHHFNKKGRQTLPLQRNKCRQMQNAQTLMYTHAHARDRKFAPGQNNVCAPPPPPANPLEYKELRLHGGLQ